MEIVKRLLIMGVLATMLEIGCFYLVIEYTNNMFPFTERGVGWGIYTYYSFWWFVILISLTNVSLALFREKKYLIPIIILLVLVYAFLIFPPYDSRPNRVLLRIILSVGFTIASIGITYVLDWIETRRALNKDLKSNASK